MGRHPRALVLHEQYEPCFFYVHSSYMHQTDPLFISLGSTCMTMDALGFELFYKVNHKGTAHELWESIKHTFGDSSTWDDGKFKEDCGRTS